MANNKLKGKIAEKGFSQRSLAEALGMSKNTLNAKVNGRVPFNTVEIERICEKLDIRDGAEKAAIFFTITVPKQGQLRKGVPKMSRAVDLTGRRFGRLVVIERAENYISPSGSKMARFKCLCDCGKSITVHSTSLVHGVTKSCGCLNYDNLKSRTGNANPQYKHGFCKERLYGVWRSMRSRCFNERSPKYPSYGGRGISICEEWLSYENFKRWAMTAGYNPNAMRGQCTIDRVDVNGNYCPENCRWVTIKEQNSNKRNSKYRKEGNTSG